MGKYISVLNFKGGTGKTTCSINLAHALARSGAPVLLVDCDLQGNSSSILPAENRGEATLTHVLKGEAAFNDAIYPARDNLDVVPSDTDLNEAANHIVATGARAYSTLRSALKRLNKEYKYIFFDLSPNYTSITETALIASNTMLIPCELTPFAISGLVDMINKLTVILEGLDHEVDIAGIVPFKLDNRYAMTEMYLTSLKKKFGNMIIQPIRTDATVPRAQSVHQTVFEYNETSKAAIDFKVLATIIEAKA